MGGGGWWPLKLYCQLFSSGRKWLFVYWSVWQTLIVLLQSRSRSSSGPFQVNSISIMCQSEDLRRNWCYLPQNWKVHFRTEASHYNRGAPEPILSDFLIMPSFVTKNPSGFFTARILADGFGSGGAGITQIKRNTRGDVLIVMQLLKRWIFFSRFFNRNLLGPSRVIT